MNWKFPNLGSCELKSSKFGGLRTKILAKIGVVKAKISIFSQKGVLWSDYCLKWDLVNYGLLKRGSCELWERREKGVLRTKGEARKGGLQGRTSPYPLSRSVPPGVLMLSMNPASCEQFKNREHFQNIWSNILFWCSAWQIEISFHMNETAYLVKFCLWITSSAWVHKDEYILETQMH